MPKFYQDKSDIHVLPDEDVVMFNKLPLGTYNIFQSDKGIYLTHTDHIWQNDYKIYGKINDDVNRIITTFKNKINSMGVLLSGTKGSGKTLVAREVSKLLYKDKYPTILVTKPINLLLVSDFLKRMKTPCLLLIDEFEKHYKSSIRNNNDDIRYSQADILGLLDGLLTDAKILTILTCNDVDNINKFLINRPGRIYYHISYNSVDITTVEEYCNDNLINKDHLKDIISLRKSMSRFSFDILQCIVEEVNRYDVSPNELIKYLNIDPDEEFINYKITVNFDNGNVATTKQGGNIYTNTLRFNINNSDYIKINEENDSTKNMYSGIEFNLKFMKLISNDGTNITYRCDRNKANVIITENDSKSIRVRDLFDL